jgi:hypothetical protein
LGLAAPGTDQLTLRALRRTPESAENFPQDVLEVGASRTQSADSGDPGSRSGSAASYFSGFDPTTISPRDRKFGGIFAIGVQAAGCISVIGPNSPSRYSTSKLSRNDSKYWVAVAIEPRMNLAPALRINDGSATRRAPDWALP